MAIYGNFNGTLKDEVKVGKQGSVIQRSLSDNSLTILNESKTSRVNLNAKGGTFNGTGAITLAAGTTAERPASPLDGMIRFNTDTNYAESYSNNTWTELLFNDAPYDIALFVYGNENNADVILCGYLASRNVTIPSSCGNSVAIANIAPTGTTVYDVRINEASVGNITFNALETVGTVSINTTEMAPGDILEIINPSSPDTTIADISITIVGEVTRTCLYIPPPPPPVVWEGLPVYLDSGADGTGWSAYALSTNGTGTWITAYVYYGSISTDNGRTWSSIDLDVTVGTTYGIETDGNGTWLAIQTNGGVTRSVDDGITWNALPMYFGHSHTNNSSGGHALGTNKTGLWISMGRIDFPCVRTLDNGDTWTKISSPVFLTGIDAYNGVATDGNGMWIATGVGTGGHAVRSIDDGLTWVLMDPDLGGVVAAGYQGVVYDGVTWMIITTGVNTHIMSQDGITWFDPAMGLPGTTRDGVASDGFGRWVVPYDNNTYSLSTDNGVSWTHGYNFNNPLSNLYPYAIATDKKGRWVAVGYRGFADISPPQ